ncbi:MAG: hypothetical protein ACKVIQ_02555 [Acidimicrobiales bacterium]
MSKPLLRLAETVRTALVLLRGGDRFWLRIEAGVSEAGSMGVLATEHPGHGAS